MGHGRPGGVRPAAAAVISGNGSHFCLLCHRLPQLAGKRDGQGKQAAANQRTNRIGALLATPGQPLTLEPPQWYPEVLHFCPYTPLLLVGLKSDLRLKQTCIDMLKTQGLTPVSPEQAMQVARKMGARYMECSSKEMSGVDDIFEQAILTVVDNDRRMLELQASSNAGDGRSGERFMGRVRKRRNGVCNLL